MTTRRGFLVGAAGLVAASGCGPTGSPPNTKQLDDAGNVLIVMGGFSVSVPAGWTQITGVVLVLVGGSLKLYVILVGGDRTEVKLSGEQLRAVQQAQSKGEQAEVRQNGSVKKKVTISKEK
jgi:hypothetical protein